MFCLHTTIIHINIKICYHKRLPTLDTLFNFFSVLNVCGFRTIPHWGQTKGSFLLLITFYDEKLFYEFKNFTCFLPYNFQNLHGFYNEKCLFTISLLGYKIKLVTGSLFYARNSSGLDGPFLNRRFTF